MHATIDLEVPLSLPGWFLWISFNLLIYLFCLYTHIYIYTACFSGGAQFIVFNEKLIHQKELLETEMKYSL